MEEGEEINQSEFNYAIGTLARIHEMKQHLAAEGTILGDVDRHYKYLKAFWKEISPVLANRKDTSYTEREKVLLSYLKENNKELLYYPLGLSLLSSGKQLSERDIQMLRYIEITEAMRSYREKKISIETLQILLDGWEQELRLLDQEHKLNLPMGSDPRYALARR